MHIEKLLRTIGAVLAVAMLSAGIAHAGIPAGWISSDRAEGAPNHYISHDGEFIGGLDGYASGDGYAFVAHENAIEILGTTSKNWTGVNMYFNGLVMTSDFMPW
jgi:hypothetical protein